LPNFKQEAFCFTGFEGVFPSLSVSVNQNETPKLIFYFSQNHGTGFGSALLLSIREDYVECLGSPKIEKAILAISTVLKSIKALYCIRPYGYKTNDTRIYVNVIKDYLPTQAFNVIGDSFEIDYKFGNWEILSY
jgi:hypothetical protein